MEKQLQDYKYISFDVWNTLLTANSTYADKRTECISDHLKIAKPDAKKLYSQVKLFLDKSAEIAGKCMSSEECWKLLVSLSRKEGVDWKQMKKDAESEFIDNPPYFNDNLVLSLKRLSDEATVGILSNTNFISGNILNEHVFDRHNIFSFKAYSDLIGYPKPNPNAFSIIKEVAGNLSESLISDYDVIHIGDHEVCDGNAVKFGIDYMQVKNSEDLLNKLKSKGY